jgi:hypothetical protein
MKGAAKPLGERVGRPTPNPNPKGNGGLVAAAKEVALPPLPLYKERKPLSLIHPLDHCLLSLTGGSQVGTYMRGESSPPYACRRAARISVQIFFCCFAELEPKGHLYTVRV